MISFRSGIILTFVLAIALGIFALRPGAEVSLARAEELANQMVSTCSTEPNKTACYEREVPTLYPKYKIPQIFDVIRIIRSMDREYQFCHVLAHNLGEAIVAEDPNSWMKAMPLNPSDGMCSNGFVHGVVGGRFRAEVLDDTTLQSLLGDFKMACEPHDGWEPTPLDQAICYHGLGHLYVFITDADLSKALSICEQTTISEKGNYGQVCREGVFMQIYQPLEPDDFLMIERMKVKPSTTTVRQFCKTYSENPAYEGACLRESWPYFRKEITSGTGLETFCSNQPNKEEELNCYRSATAIIGRMSLGKGDKAARACNSIPKEYQALCFTAVATAVLEENRKDGTGAVALCQKAEEPARNECFTQIAQRSRFIFGNNNPMRDEFCAELPNQYRALCAR